MVVYVKNKQQEILRSYCRSGFDKLNEKSRDEKILDVLKQMGVARRADLIKKTGLNDGMIARGTESLLAYKDIITEKIGYERWFGLPESEKLLEKMKKDHLEKIPKRVDSNSEISIKRFHADDLKAILRRWMEEIPEVTSIVIEEDSLTYGIHDISEYMRTGELQLPSRFPLPVETEPLFKDFENHAGFEEILTLWNDFKTSCDKINGMKKNLFSTISTELNSELCAIEQIKLWMDTNTKTKNLTLSSIIEWLYNGTVLFADKRNNIFDEWYVNFKSFTFDDGAFIVYKIGTRGHLRIAKNLMNESEFKEGVDKALKDTIEKIKSNYYSEAYGIIRLIKETNEKKEKLTYLLKKKLFYVVFEGDCEFL